MFRNNASIQIVDLHHFTSVTSVSQVFYSCTGLKKVIFPSKLTYLGYFTFSIIASNVVIILPETLTGMDGSVIRSSNAGSLIYVLHGNVGNFAGLKQSKVVKIYVPDQYLSNYQTYLAESTNLSKLYPLSEYEG